MEATLFRFILYTLQLCTNLCWFIIKNAGVCGWRMTKSENAQGVSLLVIITCNVNSATS